MSFALWSSNNPEVKTILTPDLGIRGWGDIPTKDKETIWKHFANKGWFSVEDKTFVAVSHFDENNKARAFCKNILNHGSPHYLEMRGVRQGINRCCFDPAQSDFYNIFQNEHQDVVYELLSYYAQNLKNITYERYFDRFKNLFNDISNQFGMNVVLTDNGFILRQDPKITEEIYVPVLSYLADQKWAPVSRDIGDAMSAFLKNTEEDYSRSITLTVSALQAFLQIIVHDETGKGDLGELIKTAQSKNLIPNDPFTCAVFKNLQSVFMQERRAKSDSHPKDVYADEKSARLMLNLAMVFMQHCIQK